jgi:hypothetical protein
LQLVGQLPVATRSPSKIAITRSTLRVSCTRVREFHRDRVRRW